MGGHDSGGAPGENASTGTTNAGYIEGSAPTKGVALRKGDGVGSGRACVGEGSKGGRDEGGGACSRVKKLGGLIEMMKE